MPSNRNSQIGKVQEIKVEQHNSLLESLQKEMLISATQDPQVFKSKILCLIEHIYF